MFKSITRKDGRVILLNTDEIAFVSEKFQEPVRLYDELGNLVSETAPTEKVYELVLILKNNYHKVVIIGQEEIDTIAQELAK